MLIGRHLLGDFGEVVKNHLLTNFILTNPSDSREEGEVGTRISIRKTAAAKRVMIGINKCTLPTRTLRGFIRFLFIFLSAFHAFPAVVVLGVVKTGE